MTSRFFAKQTSCFTRKGYLSVSMIIPGWWGFLSTGSEDLTSLFNPIGKN